MIVVYVFSGFMILIALLQFINLLSTSRRAGKKELLNEMFEADEIDASTYAKYVKKLE